MAKGKKSKRGPPQMWKCGGDFENPIPTATGRESKGSESHNFDKNHWKVVFDSLRDEDQKQCEMWKDEVNILLIFAGLFSAVVTAFLIESYKFLLPQDGSEPSKFGPDSPHVIRLNSLWFCSLVLALSSVIIGIVALQWIRNHQRYNDIKPRDALSVYEMRTKSLRSWHIRWAFLSLPLLILVALVLFFVGLVDFLLSLNKKVAAPVAVLVYVTLFLLSVTTVLPSSQIYWLYFFPPNIKEDTDMPTPCPYKSSQSWIFHRFLVLLVHVPMQITSIMRKFRRRGQRDLEAKVQADDSKVSLHGMPLFFTLYTSPNKWAEYDTKWLRLRDMYSQNMERHRKQRQCAPFSPVYMQHSRRPIYDEAQILIETVSKSNPSADVLFAAYHCFQEISKNALYQDIESKEDHVAPKYDERNLILRGYYWNHLTVDPEKPPFGPPISDLVETPSAHLLHDENMFVFLKMHSAHNLPEEASRVISAHLSELQGRILSYTYTEPVLHFKALNQLPVTSSKLRWLDMMSQIYVDVINSTSAVPKFKIWSQFASGSLNGNEVLVSTDTIERTIIQCSIIFDRFVRHVAELNSLDWEETIYTHQSVTQFLKVPAAMLRYRTTDQSRFDVFSQFENSFVFIINMLNKHPVANGTSTQSTDKDAVDHKPADYLFLTACLFIDYLFRPNTKPPLEEFNAKQCKFMGDFIKTLSAYEQTDNSLSRIKMNRTNIWSNTDLPKAPAFESCSDSEKLSYIRWEYIPPWIEPNSSAPSA